MAAQVHFFPEILNKPGNSPFSIEAKKWKVFRDFTDVSNENHMRYDIALVVLE